MAIGVAVYTANGVLTGVVAAAKPVDALTADGRLVVERASFASLGAAVAHSEARVEVVSDDVVLLVEHGAGDLPVHAVWHAVRLVCGTYVIDGELPTQPGFDPGRALARPSGTFVALRDVRIAPGVVPAAEIARYGRALVNRYAVEEITADLDLGFFFPGAHVAPESAAG